MNSYFDKIYVINLPKDQDRKNNMINQFNKYNIKNYKIIEGINGKNLNKEDLKKDGTWAYPGSKVCEKSCSCKGNGHRLSNNQIGLYLSHYKIWEEIIENNYEKCLILEDDCIFENMDKFEDIKKYIPQNYDLLYLGHRGKIGKMNTCRIEETNNNILKLTWGINQTHIYGITNQGAKTLLENALPIRAAVDGYFSYFMVRHKVLKDVLISRINFGLNGSLNGTYKSVL